MTVSDQRRVYAAAEIGTLYHDDDRSLDEKYGQMIAPYMKIEISDAEDALLYSAETVGTTGGWDFDGLILESVEFEESIDEADSIALVFNNPDLTLENSTLMSMGNNIDLYMGYENRAPFYMARGIVVEIEPDYPENSMPKIKLTCYDKSYFMMEEGRAEIVPEGSAWWERTRVRRPAGNSPLVSSRAVNDAVPNEDPTGTALNEIQRDNYILEQQGSSIRRREIGLDTALGRGMDFSDTPIRGDRIQTETGTDNTTGLNNPAGSDRARQSNPTAQYGWQRQRLPRRRRNSGKVWEDKKDSEIVAEIFLSYGIVPYVEATNERVSRSRRRRRPRSANPNAQSSLTGRPSMSQQDVDDLLDQAEDDQRVLTDAADDESLEEARERLEENLDDPGNPDNVDFERAQNQAFHSQLDSLADVSRNIPEVDLTRFETEQILTYGTQDERTGEDIAARFELNYVGDVAEDGPTEDTPPQAPSRNRSRRVVQRSGTSDWDFIKELANNHAFITFVFFHIESRRWIGYWGPEDHVPQYREFIFRYNAGNESSLKTVRPNISMRNQSTEIDLLYVDPVNHKENRLRVSMENVNENQPQFNSGTGQEEIREPVGDGPELVLTVHGQRVRVNADRRFNSAEEARQWLIAFWLRHAQDFFFIEGETVIGLMELRAKEHHQIEGINRYSGRFFITQSRHSMSPNQPYKTTFVGRKKVDFTEDEIGDDMVVLDQNELGDFPVEEDPNTVAV